MAGLEHDLKALLRCYLQNEERIEALWQEIQEHHSTPGRHYHTLEHLEHIHQNLLPAVAQAEDPQALLIATAYHDIIQHLLRDDDEQRSAILMRDRMAAAGVPPRVIDRAERHILATKAHEASADKDTDLFCDADLAILGSPADRYDRYAEQVRKEYPLVPDPLFKRGRRRVLEALRDRPGIFRSPAFKHLEEQARRNIDRELAGL